MELAAPKSHRYSLQEYFRLAEESPTKLEYNAGEIIDMAGATYDHNRIAANLLGEIRNRLKGGPCEATGSDTRVLAADDRYAYPDVTVVCGEPEFDPRDSKNMTITNPAVLFEVLSDSSEAGDRGEKFIRRDDGSWSVGDIATDPSGQLRIPPLGIELPMREIYANVDFQNGQVPAETR